jgi:hypothetical protein
MAYSDPSRHNYGLQRTSLRSAAETAIRYAD